MKVFLTGATGYVGSAVAEKLMTAGHSVLGLARNPATADKLEARGIRPFVGDLRDPARLAVATQQADGVVHTAFIHDFDDWSRGVEADCRVIAAFTDAMAGTDEPLIGTSDTSVLGDTGSTTAEENHPIAADFFLAARAEAEARLVRASRLGVRSAVLRLPLYIYGRGGGTSYVPMRLEEAKELGVVHYVAPGDHLVSAAHVDDVARLYVLALEHAEAGSVFHAVSESGISEKAIAEAIAKVTGLEMEGLSAGQAAERWGPVIAAFFSISNQASSQKAIDDLGWHPEPPVPFLEDIAGFGRPSIRPPVR